MPEILTGLFAIMVGLVAMAALVYIGGFILSMIAMLVYAPIEAVRSRIATVATHTHMHHGRHALAA